MKFITTALFFLASTSTDAFAPYFVGRPHSSQLMSKRHDTTNYIRKAMETMKKYGRSSREARLAWETVEELDSSTRHGQAQALRADLEECELKTKLHLLSTACLEHDESIRQLQVLIDLLDNETLSRPLDVMIDEIEPLKLPEPNVNSGTSLPNPRADAAWKAAKQATSQYGVRSRQARLAWEEYEEISSVVERDAALEYKHGKMDDVCQVDASCAICQAMKEVNRLISANR